MKILLITDNHSIGGGAEKYFFALKDQLKQHPSIDVVSLGFGSKAAVGDDFIVLKASVSKISRQWWNMFFHPLKYLQLRRFIKKINPDVIHLHNIRKYTIALLHAVRGYPVVQTVHDYYPICPTMTNIHKNLRPCLTGLRLKCIFQHAASYPFYIYPAILFSFVRMRKLIKKRIHYFIAPSSLLAYYLNINHFTPVMTVSPFTQRKMPLSTQASKPGYFLYVGRIEKNKGTHLLIDEFASACKQRPDLILKLAGDGPLAKTLQEKIKTLHLEKNIYFLGAIQEPHTLNNLYEECMAVIFPSIGLESFGLVLTEAMGHARPVIGSSRGPTISLIEHGKSGLIFDPLENNALAKCVLTLANDPALSEKLGKNAFEKMQTFPNNKEIIDTITGIYKQVAEGNQFLSSAKTREERK